MTNHSIKIGPVYSALSSQELFSKILPLFNISAPISCQFWRNGINDSYKVITKNGKYLLRIYRKGWRKKTDIEFELSILNHLHHKGVNVASPLSTMSGAQIIPISAAEGERFAIITSFAEGDIISCDIKSNAELFGKSVANIHAHSENFNPQHDRYKLDLAHLIDEPLRRIKPYLKDRASDWKFLNNYASTLKANILSKPPKLLDIGFCHGDFHSGNAHEFNGEITFFDFDCCGIGYRAYDLAVFKWSAIRANKEEKRWSPFIKAYRQVRSISEHDLALIDSFVAIRHIWFMGLHVDVVITEGILSDKYFTTNLKFLKSLSDSKKLI